MRDRNVDIVRKKGEIISYTYNKMFNVDSKKELLDVKYGKYKENVLDIYFPKSNILNTIILFVHGGGWISLDKSLYKPVLLNLASKGYLVFNINYRLAPEHSVEDMEEDIMNAIDFAISFSSKSNVALMGDSAGAHLVSLVTNKLYSNLYLDNHLKNNINCNLLFYGVFDLTNVLETHFHDVDTYLYSIVKTDEDKKKYSPVNYICDNLPPVFIASGYIDKLNSESLEYSKLLKEHNIYTESLFFSKRTLSAHHSFLNYYTSYACRESINELTKFLNKVVK